MIASRLGRAQAAAHLFGALHIYSAGKSKNLQSRHDHATRRRTPGRCKSFHIRFPVPERAAADVELGREST
jgi:hypothetical protein